MTTKSGIHKQSTNASEISEMFDLIENIHTMYTSTEPIGFARRISKLVNDISDMQDEAEKTRLGERLRGSKFGWFMLTNILEAELAADVLKLKSSEVSVNDPRVFLLVHSVFDSASTMMDAAMHTFNITRAEDGLLFRWISAWALSTIPLSLRELANYNLLTAELFAKLEELGLVKMPDTLSIRNLDKLDKKSLERERRAYYTDIVKEINRITESVNESLELLGREGNDAINWVNSFIESLRLVYLPSALKERGMGDKAIEEVMQGYSRSKPAKNWK